MKLVALPSGITINMEQVAYVDASEVPANKSDDERVIKVYFPALAYAQSHGMAGGGPLCCRLQGKDATAFLAALGHLLSEAARQ